MRFIQIVITTLSLLTSGIVSAQLNVVTTTQDLAALAQAVGGSHIHAEALTMGTRDPHFAEARPSMIRVVHGADVLVVVGADLEIGWLPAVLRSARNAKVQTGGEGFLDLSEHVALLGKASGPVDRSLGDVHVQGNPHYWLDPQNGLVMARTIADKLIEMDKTHRVDYEANFASFEKTLQTKIKQWHDALSILKGKKIIVYHNSLLYLAKTFGFEIVAEIEPKPGISPSAAHLAKLVSTIKSQDIDLLLMEPYYERRSAEFLQRNTGIQVYVIPQSVGSTSKVTNYIELFDEIVFALRGVK